MFLLCIKKAGVLQLRLFKRVERIVGKRSLPVVLVDSFVVLQAEPDGSAGCAEKDQCQEDFNARHDDLPLFAYIRLVSVLSRSFIFNNKDFL